MEAVILCGIQGSGKTTFYEQMLAETHVRVSLDVLKTRAREREVVRDCLDGERSFAVDNTNPRVSDRRRYIVPARQAGFGVIGYFFPVTTREAIARNQIRTDGGRVPVPAILSTYRLMQPPVLEEGFDRLYVVRNDREQTFVVQRYVAESDLGDQ